MAITVLSLDNAAMCVETSQPPISMKLPTPICALILEKWSSSEDFSFSEFSLKDAEMLIKIT